jgi:hypothetical protein
MDEEKVRWLTCLVWMQTCFCGGASAPLPACRWLTSSGAHKNRCVLPQAVTDFRKRINHYEEVYEPIMDRSLHYIKLIDM